MTTVAVPSIKEGCFMVRGKAVLHGVPQNVSVKPVTLQSVFIGAKSTSPSSHHIFTLGHLEAKIWWMIPRVGESANQIPVETQMLLQGARRDSAASLQGNTKNELQLRFESGKLAINRSTDSTAMLSEDPVSCARTFATRVSGDTNVQTTEALESVLVNSGDNLFEVIKDSINSKKSAVARASEDFMPRESTFQTLHVTSVAFNGLLLGEVMVPDWDMFQTVHDKAEFHAAARAAGSCPVYISNKPWNHDFKILEKLVLPDGSVLRAKYAGVFNCQGAGPWPLKQGGLQKPITTLTFPPISTNLRPVHVEFLEEVAGENWNGDCAVYAFNSGSLVRLPKSRSTEVSLRTFSCKVYTISPIQGVEFAPIGLLDMYNSGGALEALNFRNTDLLGCTVDVKMRGCGWFGGYSSVKPRHCRVDMEEAKFSFSDEDNLLIVKLPKECYFRVINIVY
ncbi:hypothetical protein CDL15_Pgr014848 [Punica granatum]|uniref:Uncharacterized protein n=2 Tax=Punica granatum TaxID=22663 RepID=A0A218XZL9_PUNGR|nr:hypothetical protein CDL15_Pgr014848 [Punica granatum]